MCKELCRIPLIVVLLYSNQYKGADLEVRSSELYMTSDVVQLTLILKKEIFPTGQMLLFAMQVTNLSA